MTHYDPDDPDAVHISPRRTLYDFSYYNVANTNNWVILITIIDSRRNIVWNWSLEPAKGIAFLPPSLCINQLVYVICIQPQTLSLLMSIFLHFSCRPHNAAESWRLKGGRWNVTLYSPPFLTPDDLNPFDNNRYRNQWSWRDDTR